MFRSVPGPRDTHRVSLVLRVLHAPVAVVERLSLDGQLQVPLPHALRHDLQLQLQVAAVLLTAHGP